MSFETLSERLSVLQESNRQARALIDRLENINFQPGSIPLDNDDNNVMTELASEIKQILKEQDEDFQIFEQEVAALTTPRRRAKELAQEKEGLVESVHRAVAELKRYQSSFRRAQVIAKEKLSAARDIERALILESYLQPELVQSTPIVARRRNHTDKEATQEEKELNATSEITKSLRRVMESMNSEVQRSQFAHETLLETTRALEQLNESFSSLDTLLSKSRNLLGTLIRSQKTDEWYLQTALYLLLFTVSWLVFRRFIYGPAWWLIYTPTRLLLKALFAAFGVVGAGSATQSSVSISSVAPRATVSHSTGTRSSVPTQAHMSRSAPSIVAGGGGRGAPIGGHGAGAQHYAASAEAQRSMTAKVEKIIDDSLIGQEAGQEPGEEKSETDEGNDELETEGLENPKKRMWEEDVEEAKREQAAPVRKKDEL